MGGLCFETILKSLVNISLMEINLVDLWWIALSGQLEGHSWITGVLASTEMPDISCTGDEQLVEN
jgi:hypothetical protein